MDRGFGQGNEIFNSTSAPRQIALVQNEMKFGFGQAKPSVVDQNAKSFWTGVGVRKITFVHSSIHETWIRLEIRNGNRDFLKA